MPDSTSPYFIPDDGRKYLLHVSGGRTSGYMLRQILDAHGGRLPLHVRAVFANTGKEREETLVFLREMQERWSVPLEWIEYTYRAGRRGGRGPAEQKNWFRRINFVTARREGEPFAELIQSRQMLPNVVMRMCTEDLKVNTASRYARHVLGWIKPLSILGIRADEPQRVRVALFEECRTTYPMVDAGATESDVMEWWGSQPFDLQLRQNQGNCDLCFLKGIGKLKRLIAEEPDRADWWIEQEDLRHHWTRRPERALNKPEMARFMKRYNYRELRGMQMLPLDGLSDDRPVSCFCGD